MSYCVFMHRSDSIYEDIPAEQYQFPRQYLARAEPSVGSWILYLEPRKVHHTRGYFAVARVQEIIPDPNVTGMFVALIEQGSYLEFPNSVPFSEQDGPLERGLLNESGNLSGRAQSAVRPISDVDFLRIVERGLAESEPFLPRLDDTPAGFELHEVQSPFVFEQVRDRTQYLMSRALRDRAFRRLVLRAYGERCAFTGLKLINGGGRAEVNAAHIRPVESKGPDSVTNGIALSGTAHWMFDRGLVSLTNDLEIIISRQVNDLAAVRGFINQSGYAFAPDVSKHRAHPKFIEWHRENIFKH
ncbi:HNH endonuclease [Oricola cellulosilytica]|uniref:Restriction endonuclease n=1 Tax=Oricola cellulosilytica TaxID=1429082 RepID=A0A4R0PCV3_9HYPH|nr:HNH endonuclease [Oricola cellulosilytica]TCD15310.1 restriction endonuclease [Oricola cellulosilytica]